MDNRFYVYKWYYKDSNKIFYIGKGTKSRYKNTKRRNQKFLEIYNANPSNCDVEIIKYFDTEEEAFSYEKQLILDAWDNGEAEANIDCGGKGGYRAIWTERRKQYLSEFNPMKTEEQKLRLSEDNPMKKSECIEKYQWSRGHNIVIDNVTYPSVYEAARQLDKDPGTIFRWGKKGITSDGKCCYYTDITIDTIEKDKYKNRPKRANAHPVIVDGIVYDSVREAARAIDGDATNIIRAIKANRLYKNHTCSYVNQQPS